MNPSIIKVPPLKDLNINNITENTVLINSRSGDARLTYLMECLVTHLHDFARETRLSTGEWMAALNFLVKVGQISSDVRHEFILLSDILGLSLLVDSINHPKPPASTEGSVLGPFHTHEADTISNGQGMSSDTQGEPCLVVCTVHDVSGSPIPGVKIDIWETDSTGHYDVQYNERGGPDGRALYIRGDPYESSDAVFGVKQSLIVDFDTVDTATAKQYGVTKGIKVLRHDFVLVSDKEAEKLRDENALAEIKKLGKRVKMLNHLPVPDVD
ncbi:uncharacterized protein ATNIH1004_005368 [Aspergillus tanneri]|uniref:Catechol dioxygenase N-terminal domain-containing protein n=1 Tax=Aspergillus tanneri TaxID=1220188 RepID=A0A5M9MP26_9EURO|nr:uncharacterized protein ATNIH1004_005368 [Aspergillus tanneri]KAA8646693.1 hypothetical protein ATNIH1004_005368 [Aspergillus tanneri]